MRLSWAFWVFVIHLVTSVESKGSNTWSDVQLQNRQKRMVMLIQCPENASAETCLEDVKGKSGGCYHFAINSTPGQEANKPSIVVTSCGKLYCGAGKIYVPGDPSKPHPACCQSCGDV